MAATATAAWSSPASTSSRCAPEAAPRWCASPCSTDGRCRRRPRARPSVSDSFRVLDAPAAGWDALARDDPNATPSHRPELWSALADALPGGSVRFVAVESDGSLIGGAGIVLERRAGFEWIHALPWLLGGAPLAAPGRHARVDAAFAAALATLMRERRPVGGEWALYRAAGAEPDPGVLGRVPGETTRIETALVRLDQGLDAV